MKQNEENKPKPTKQPKKCQPQPHKEVYNGSLRNIWPIGELAFS